MVKVKAVNIYPGQIDELLKDIQGVSSEYNVLITNENGKDVVYLNFEVEKGASIDALEKEVAYQFKSRIGISIYAQGGRIGSLPRSEKKSVRITDERYE